MKKLKLENDDAAAFIGKKVSHCKHIADPEKIQIRRIKNFTEDVGAQLLPRI